MSAAPALPPPHRLLAVVIGDYPLSFPEERDPRVEAAVFARACRAYPSFVRQHHAVLALRAHFPVVAWDRRLDQLQGVDVLVQTSPELGLRMVAVGLAGKRRADAPVPAPPRGESRGSGSVTHVIAPR